MTFSSLRQLAEPTPTCAEHATLEIVLSLFSQSDHERLVILDAEARPVGIIHLNQLLPYLTASQLSSQPVCSEPDASANLVYPVSWPDHPSFHASLSPAPIAHPLGTVPVELDWEQLWSHLATSEHTDWAVVDSEQRYIGLLDVRKLIQYWMIHSEERHNIRSAASTAFSPTVSKVGIPASFTASTIWTQVLNQVPSPLMIQTHAGQVIFQNESWRTEVGALQYPNWIREEAAILLRSGASQLGGEQSQPDAILFPTQSNTYGLDEVFLKAHPYGNRIDPSVSTSTLPRSKSQFMIPGSCQAGADPNSCFCACLTQDGLIRVWQFVKIPLGVSLEQLIGAEGPYPFSAASASPSLISDSPEDFRLAELQPAPQEPIEKTASEAINSPTPSTEDLWLIVARDTTEQQQLSQELAARTADLVQLNRFKDEFLACISHELKTPLTAVLGLSRLLKEQSVGALNERQVRYTRLMHESARHLMTIVNNILDLTRIETDQLELVLQPLSIQSVCQRVIDQTQQSVLAGLEADAAQTAVVTARTIALEIEVGLTLLFADELRLRQMLTNLLSNALKFTSPEGQVGLEVRSWESWIAFTVWDTGIGIPAEKQHLIFQKFQQLESPLTRQFEGAGLGLVLTQRLARLHGGDVTFTSTEGQGSRFTLLLPPAPPEVALNLNLDLALSVHMPRQNRLILVVEAVTHFIDDLTEKIMRLGYRVAIARSGPEALEKIRRLQPCAVFLNPLLPLLSGWDVLTLLKSDTETQHIPVVVTATPVEQEQAQQCRADEFLTLPIEKEALQQVLARLDSLSDTAPSGDLSGLTVLFLGPEQSSAGSEQALAETTALHHLLHLHHCRLLEADDLDQGEILARVWRPDVILLDPAIPDPELYTEALSHHTYLASLPIVTLTTEMTQAANRILKLSVYPCLAFREIVSQALEPTALLQVIQVAAGLARQPHILILDILDLLDSSVPTERPERKKLETLGHYLQAASFQSSMGYTWQETWQQIQHQTVDLVLVALQDEMPLSDLMPYLHQLSQMQPRPPILLLDYRNDPEIQPDNSLEMQLHSAVDRVLPAAVSVRSLLDQINFALSHAPSKGGRRSPG